MFMARRGVKWQRASHHKDICDALTRVFDGSCLRLIMNLPPRYSKTELAVINFMSWALGRCPDAEFIHTSYSTRLASSNSWKTRDLSASEEYRGVFPEIQLRDDSQARDEWRTAAGGCVYAVGTGGSITGYGAGKLRSDDRFGGAIVIDDPIKPDEIRHDTARQGVIDWFQNTLESRKNAPNTPIILIMQRLHEEDLAGWLLAGGNGEKWEHVNFPAIQDDGTALWSEKHDLAKLRQMQSAAPIMFAGQYQQVPAPAEGAVFRPDEIRVVDVALVKRWVRSWDLAASEDDGDWTVGALVGETDGDKYTVGDIVRFQGAPDEVEKRIVKTAETDGRNVTVSLDQDPGQAGKSQVVYLTGKLAGYKVVSAPISGDKVVRAGPFASQINVGNVSMVRAEWNRSYIHELRHFPFSKYDDQVDASSRAFSVLTEKLKRMIIPKEVLERSRNKLVTAHPTPLMWLKMNRRS